MDGSTKVEGGLGSAAEVPATQTVSESHVVTFSTRGLPRERQAESWRAGNATSLDLVFDADRRADCGFAADRDVVRFGSLVMTRIAIDSVTALRTRGHIQRDGLDHWCVNVTTRGDRRFRLDRHDRCISVPAGQLHVQSLDEAYRSFAEDIEWIGVFFPRDSLPALSVHLDATRDHPRNDALSRMLGDYLVRLWAILPTMTSDELSRAAEATMAVISAFLSATPDALTMAKEHLQSYQRARALSFIRRNLGSSQLSAEAIMLALGTTRTQLYRAFEPLGGVAQAIREERLKAAKILLSKTTEERTISEIAEALGMIDFSTFSRQFRRSFGVSPSEVRNSAQVGCSVREATDIPRVSLADFLL
ncbi:helix-turn-helix domain-containing protein [Roseococcus pinisoli]|uniref:Helix-turn-helix transcriptional regulator n=1 Tax=Roseococcus pinisoli TaxID=2835040 RepID=A0ABS5QA60_9PROT|nr:AraC family transcriptional regulator [Roseococcus pinisoli]MBS7810550.1 helix-turn-helix transcriptional regulator [Roseococcus pinisoli]